MASFVALAVAVVGGVLFVGQASQPDETSPAEAVVPVVELPGRLSGPKALKELGGAEGEDLDTVARAHGMAPKDLARSLEQDDGLHVDANGRLFYVDDFGHDGQGGHDHAHDAESLDSDLVEGDLSADGELAPGVAGYSSSGAPGGVTSSVGIAPLSQTFELSSFPNPSGPTVFLDFDGHEFAPGDQWGLAGQQAKAWDPSYDGSAFNDSELIRIQQIWARVAEHFSFAEINVTTQEPPAAAFQGTGNRYAVRVLISPNIYTADVEDDIEVGVDPDDPDQANGGIMGLAYVGTAVMGETVEGVAPYRQTPALVFAGRMNGMDDTQYATTISHEAGHNFAYVHSFEASTYQTKRKQGADSSPVHHLVMDYVFPPRGSAFFTAEERNSLLGDVTFGGVARRPAPLPAGGSGEDHDASDSTVSGWLTGTDPFDTFLLAGCGGDVTVRVVAGAVGPTLDLGLQVQEGTSWSSVAPLVAESAPDIGIGTALRNAGIDADVTFSTEPGTTYVVKVAKTGSGTPAVYPEAYTYGRYTGSVEGCGAPVVAPTVPTGLTAALETSGGVPTGAALVSWGAPAHRGGEQPTYEIAVDGQRLRALDAATFSHRIASTPEAGTRLRLRAVNSAGTSPWVEATTPSLAAPKAPAHVSATRYQEPLWDADTGEQLLNGDGTPAFEWRVLLNVVHQRDFVPSSIAGTAHFYVPVDDVGTYRRYVLTSMYTQVTAPAEELLPGTRVMYEISHPGRPAVQTWVTVRERAVAPAQVRNLTATLDGSDLDVSWNKPADDGGAWLKYRVRVNDGAWVDVDRLDLTHTFEGLAPAAEYKVDVMAHHARGSSLASVVVPGVPAGSAPASKPQAVEIVEDSAGATLRWAEPKRLRGGTVSAWRVTIGERVVDVAAGERDLTLTGFRAGRTLTVTLAAVTTDGTSTFVGDAATVSLGPGL